VFDRKLGERSSYHEGLSTRYFIGFGTDLLRLPRLHLGRQIVLTTWVGGIKFGSYIVLGINFRLHITLGTKSAGFVRPGRDAPPALIQ